MTDRNNVFMLHVGGDSGEKPIGQLTSRKIITKVLEPR